MSLPMHDDTARLRELLASCTPELLTVSAEQMTALIRRGAEHQKPRARRFDETKFEDDGELISLLLKNSSPLLDRIEALEAGLRKIKDREWADWADCCVAGGEAKEIARALLEGSPR